MIRAYLGRTFRRPLFFASILGVWGVCMLRLANGALTSADVAYDLELLVDVDGFRKVMAVFAALPFAPTFAEEWKANMSYSCILRCSPKKYAWAQVAACFLTSFAASMAGFMLFIACDSLRLPLYVPDGNPLPEPYGCLLGNGMVWAYLMAVSANFSLSLAMWSVSGLLMSAVFPDRLVAACTPFAASYLLERVTLEFPAPFNFLHAALSEISIMGSPVLSSLHVLLLFSLASLAFGFIFVCIVERRARSEIC